MLLTIFLVLWLPYTVITDDDSQTMFTLILFPFVIANIIFSDFIIWNYMEGKKKWLIWVIETALSAGILYWLI